MLFEEASDNIEDSPVLDAIAGVLSEVEIDVKVAIADVEVSDEGMVPVTVGRGVTDSEIGVDAV